MGQKLRIWSIRDWYSNVVEYLGPSNNNSNHSGSIPIPTVENESANYFSQPTAHGLNNNYVHVLHTNGIHHIGLFTCSCHGQDTITLDLFACRLLPASFVQIHTIFTAQLMDYFQLCNLKLKALAY